MILKGFMTKGVSDSNFDINGMQAIITHWKNLQNIQYVWQVLIEGGEIKKLKVGPKKLYVFTLVGRYSTPP